VLPTNTLRLNESSDFPMFDIRRASWISRIRVWDAKTHTHVNDETVLFIDENIF
jgi:hypothetical protein